MPNKLHTLYQNLKKIDNGFTRTYEEFVRDMQDENNRKCLHSSLSTIDNSFTRTYEEFNDDMGFVKPPTSVSPRSDAKTPFVLPEIPAVHNPFDRLPKRVSLTKGKTIEDAAKSEYEEYRIQPENQFKAKFESFKSSPTLYKDRDDATEGTRLPHSATNYINEKYGVDNGIKRVDFSRSSEAVEQVENYASNIKKRRDEEFALKDFLTNTQEGRTIVENEKQLKNHLVLGVDARKNELNEKIKKFEQENNVALLTYTGIGARPGLVGAKSKQRHTWDQLQVAKSITDDTQRILKEVGQENRDGLAPALRGFKDSVFDAETWSLGISDLRNSSEIYKAAKAFEKGETLTEEERLVLDVVAENLVINAYYGSDIARQYKWGQIAGESAPFMLEMLLNPISGAGKGIAKSIAKYGIKKLGAKGAGKLFLKAGARFAGDTGAALSMTATSGLPRTIADATRRMTGEADYSVNDDGTIEYAGHHGGKGVLQSVLEALGANTIEYQSEMLGNSRLGGLLKHIPGVKGISNAIGASKLGQLLSKMDSSTLYRNLKRYERKAQWNGTLGEYGEEVYGTFMNALLVGDNEFSDLADIDQQVDTFMGLAVTGGAMSAMNTAGYVTDRAKIAHKIQTSSNEAAKHFADWKKEKQAIDGMSVGERANIVAEIVADKSIAPEAKKAVADYISARTYEDSQSGAMAEIEKTKAEKEYIDSETRIANTLQTAREQMQHYVNETSGTLVRAKLKGTNDEVQIVKGILLRSTPSDSLNETDSKFEIDKDKSDDVVYYLDEEGNTQVTTADMVEVVGNEDPEVFLSDYASRLRAYYFPESAGVVEEFKGGKDFEESEQAGMTDGTVEELSADEQAAQVFEAEKAAFMERLPIVESGKDAGKIDQSQFTPEQTIKYFEYTYGKDETLAATDTQVKNLSEGLKKEQEKLEKNPFDIAQKEKVSALENELKAYSDYAFAEKQARTDSAPTSDDNSQLTLDEVAQSDKIQPIGKGFFGDVYDQFRGKSKEAVKFLLHKKSGEVVGALSHPQVGEIDLVWGNEKAGLQKISVKHPEVLDNLQAHIDAMAVKVNSDNRVVLESPTHRAVVSKNIFDEESKQWLLTAYERRNDVASDSSIDIEPESLTDKQNGTAPLQSNNVSKNKDNTEISENQINNIGFPREAESQNEALGSLPETHQPEVSEKEVNEFYDSAEVMQIESPAGNLSTRPKDMNPSTPDSPKGITVMDSKNNVSSEIMQENEGENLSDAGSRKSEEAISSLSDNKDINNNKESKKLSKKGNNAKTPIFNGNIFEYAKNILKNRFLQKEGKKVDPNPSDAQKEAGNYKKGHVRVQGFDITIENPKGSERGGVDADGKSWSVTMQHHYGYFKRTEGKDGDQIDVFIGPNPESKQVFVIDQITPDTGIFDESKVMLGFSFVDEARDAYLSNYEEGWQGLGALTETNVDDFKKWLYDGAKQGKAFGEYADVKENSDVNTPPHPSPEGSETTSIGQGEETNESKDGKEVDDSKGIDEVKNGNENANDVRQQSSGEMERTTPKKLQTVINLLKKTGLAADVKTGKEFWDKLANLTGAETFRNRIVAKDNELFNKELDDFQRGAHKGLLHLGIPLEKLRVAGVNADELTLSPKVLNRKLKQHGLTTDDLKGLSGAMQDPILVYRHGLKVPNIIVVTELNVKGGKLSASIVLDTEGNVVAVDNVSSIHSKNAKKELTRLEDYNEEELKSALGWVEKEKVLDWLGTASLYGDMHTVNPKLNLITKIIESFENPIFSEEKRYLRRPNGTVYGFVDANNVIYLNPDEVNLNTPIHEFGHLWTSHIEKNYPDLYVRAEKVFTDSPYMAEVKADPNYAHLNEKQQLDEAMAGAIGDKGELVAKSGNIGMLAKIKAWINEVWKRIGAAFGVKNLTPAQISNLTWEDIAEVGASELLSGKPLNEANKEVDELNDIKERAIADGTFMKAPNGTPTKLNECQWLQVRTKAFKEWFGDWEKAARIEKLRSAKPIKISGKEINEGKDIKEFKANALAYGKTLRGDYVNTDTGERIFLGKNALKEVLHHDYKNLEQLQSIAAIPEIIENSIYIDSKTNDDIKLDAEKFDYYVSGLKINGEDYTVRSVIVTTKDDTRYYDHKLTQIEKGKLLDSLIGTNPGFNQKETLNTKGKDKVLLSILQTNSSKVVDDNGEPLVVYHGTSKEFNKFNISNDGDFGKGIYFTTEIEKGKLINEVGALSPTLPSNNKSALSDVKDTKLVSILQTNHSKVVDENGEPLMVYHGTSKEFNEFNILNDGDFGKGIYFTTDIEDAESYAAIDSEMAKKKNKKVYSLFLSIKNPYTPSNFEWKNHTFDSFYDENDSPIDTRKILVDRGYDGVLVMAKIKTENGLIKANVINKSNVLEIVAFSPSQIKSATANVGTFDERNDDIRFRKSSDKHRLNKEAYEGLVKQYDEAETLDERYEAAKEIIRGIERVIGDDWSDIAKTHEDFIRLTVGLTEEEKADIRNGETAGMYDGYTVLIDVEANDSADELIKTWFHENAHRISRLFYSNEELAAFFDKINPDFEYMDEILPESYRNEDSDVKGDEVLARIVEMVVESNTLEDVVNNDIDYSEMPKRLRKFVEPIFNILYNERIYKKAGRGATQERQNTDRSFSRKIRTTGLSPHVDDNNQGAGRGDSQTDKSISERDGQGNGNERRARGDSASGVEGVSGEREIVESRKSEKGIGLRPVYRGQSIVDWAREVDEWNNRDEVRFSVRLDKESLPKPPVLHSGMSLEEIANAVALFKNRTDEVFKDVNREMAKISSLYTAFIDRARPLEKYQTLMSEKGASMTDAQNAYSDYITSSSRATRMIQEYEKTKIEPLQKLLSKAVRTLRGNKKEVYRWHVVDERTGEMINDKPITDYDRLGLYLQAKDIVEADSLKGVAKRGAQGFENNVQDTNGKGVKPEDYIRDFEKIVEQKNINEIWDNIRSVNKWALDVQYHYGLIDEETYDEYAHGSRHYYVPQRGWRERDLNDDRLYYATSKEETPDNPFNSALVKAKGRETLAGDPLAYMQSIGESTVMAAMKNQTKQKFLSFAEENSDFARVHDFFSFKQVFYVATGKQDADGNMTYERTYTPPLKVVLENDKEISDLLKEVEKSRLAARKDFDAGKITKTKLDRLLSKLDEKAHRLHNNIVVKYTDSEASRIAQVTAKERKQHTVSVLRDGKEYELIFSQQYDGERVANVLNRNFGKASDGDLKFMHEVNEGLRKGTRYMSAMMTQYNPTFAVMNGIRDFGIASVSNVAEFGVGYQARFMANIGKVQGTVWKYSLAEQFDTGKQFTGNKDSKTKYDVYLKEFFEDGAATGWSFLKDVDQLRKDMKRAIDPTQSDFILHGKFGVYNVGGLKQLFGMFTEVSELTTRFAEYVTSRETKNADGSAKYTRQQASIHAKEVSVNFDRKGNQKFFGTLFSFFNASIQGTNKLFRMIRDPQVRYGMVATSAAMLTGGLLQAMLMPDPDDDEERMWTEWELMNYFCIGKVKIPLPQGLRAFWGIGVQAGLAARERKDIANAVADGTKYFFGELIPEQLVFWMNGIEIDETTEKVAFNPTLAVRGMIPTTVQPVYDVWQNTNFMGGTSYRTEFTNATRDTKSERTLGKRNVSEAAQWLSDWLWVRGGGDVKDGSRLKKDDTAVVASLFDLNPSKIETLTRGYAAGTGKFAMDMFTLCQQILSPDKKIDVSRMSIANALYKQPREYSPLDSKLWQLKDKTNFVKTQFNDIKKNNPERYKRIVSFHTGEDGLLLRNDPKAFYRQLERFGTKENRMFGLLQQSKLLQQQIAAGMVAEKSAEQQMDVMLERFRELQ